MSTATLADLDLQATLDALASPVRREILWLIWGSELPAGQIAVAVGVTAPTISSHLAVLRAAGLVSMRAEGNFRYYRAERDALEGLTARLGPPPEKWVPITPPPEPPSVVHATDLVASVAVELPCTPEAAFVAFTDPERYGEWLGVPVSLVDDHFATTMEWGTRIRGHYDIVVPPELIALRWDFDDDAIPIPSRGLRGYLRFTPTDSGVRVEVQQLVTTPEQADFMHLAWGYVLGRLAESQGLEPRRDER